MGGRYSEKRLAENKARILKHISSFKNGVGSHGIAENLNMDRSVVMICLRELNKDEAIVQKRRGKLTIYIQKPVYEKDWFEGWKNPITKMKAPRLGL